MAAVNKIQFKVGEYVLCYSGLMIYKAKCTNLCHTPSNKPLYYVHYLGWKNRYDEWVDGERILKMNPENMEKMDKLKRLYSNVKKRPTKQTIKGLQPKRGLKNKMPKKPSVNLNQRSIPSVSTLLNETSIGEETGSHSRSNNVITSNIKPIGSPDVDANKKQADNLNQTNLVQIIRSNQLMNKEQPCIIIEESNLQVARSVPNKEGPAIIDFIDLTKDEVKINKGNHMMFNIYINNGFNQKPAVRILKN